MWRCNILKPKESSHKLYRLPFSAAVVSLGLPSIRKCKADTTAVRFAHLLACVCGTSRELSAAPDCSRWSSLEFQSPWLHVFFSCQPKSFVLGMHI